MAECLHQYTVLTSRSFGTLGAKTVGFPAQTCATLLGNGTIVLTQFAYRRGTFPSTCLMPTITDMNGVY